jgi:hypothetical protein
VCSIDGNKNLHGAADAWLDACQGVNGDGWLPLYEGESPSSLSMTLMMNNCLTVVGGPL